MKGGLVLGYRPIATATMSNTRCEAGGFLSQRQLLIRLGRDPGILQIEWDEVVEFRASLVMRQEDEGDCVQLEAAPEGLGMSGRRLRDQDV